MKRMLALAGAVTLAIVLYRRGRKSTPAQPRPANAMRPDLTELTDRQLAAHGDQAVVSWFGERERVKEEWRRRNRPDMADRQEKRERESDQNTGPKP